MNEVNERERATKWAADFARPRNDDYTRWDAAELELGELCANPDTRAAFLRVCAVAAALSETIDYTKNPDGDCHVANDWGVDVFGPDAYELSSLLGNLADIIALRASINS